MTSRTEFEGNNAAISCRLPALRYAVGRVSDAAEAESPGRGRPGLLRPAGVPVRRADPHRWGTKRCHEENALILPELQFPME